MKSKINFLVLALVTLVIVGCSTSHQEKLLQEYGGTYVGDNSQVSQILGKLPSAGTGTSMALTDQIITANFHLDENDDMPSKWLETEDSMEKIMLFNATYLTILVPNAKGFAFNVEEYSFSITRDDMTVILAEQVGYLLTGDDQWDQELVLRYIEENKEDIIEMVDSDEFRKQFFDVYPIELAE